jgi:hypothetical protein
MSTRSSDSRAEARRRARLAARGDLPPEPEAAETAPAAQASGAGGFLRRLFPAAPPLPNRPDPLSGFEPEGPLRPVRERAFLLRRNLLAWLGFGLIAFFGFFASFFYGNTVLGLVGTFLLFGALIAAGWFGWQRPTLYGTAAALVSYFLATALILLSFALQGAAPETFGTPVAVIGNLVIQAAYQAALGFIGGWYGGYLRRRQTQINAEVRRRR